MLYTRLCALLGIDVPIMVAPMGPNITSLELAAAVSNAGGLGIISFGGNPPPLLQDQIHRLRDLTDKPFGVNLILHFPVEELVNLCLQEQVPVLSFFWGDCSPYVERAHTAGIIDTTEEGTVRTTLFGHGWPNAPHRAIRTQFVDKWLKEEHRGSEQRPDEPVIGETTFGGQRIPVLRFMGFPPSTDATGEIEAMGMLAGQSVGLVQEIKPAAEVVKELIEGADLIIKQRLKDIVNDM